MVGDAGVIQSEVVLISQKGGGDDRRWVYLDVGKFNGLAETMDESIKYRLVHGPRRRREVPSSSPGRPATARISSMRSPTIGCRWASSPATRSRSCPPAPTPRATPRSRSTASRRSAPTASDGSATLAPHSISAPSRDRRRQGEGWMRGSRRSTNSPRHAAWSYDWISRCHQPRRGFAGFSVTV